MRVSLLFTLNNNIYFYIYVLSIEYFVRLEINSSVYPNLYTGSKDFTKSVS